MSEPVIDGTYQIKQGPDFAIPKLAGGTGRTDGGVPLTVVSVMNESGSTIAQGTVVKLATLYPVGPGLIVTPTTAVGDIALGVAMEDIADQEGGPMAMIGSPVLVLTTGTVVDGDLLAPSATSGRAKVLTATDETAFAISLNETSGTSSVYAVLLGLFKSVTYSQFAGAVNIVIGDGVNVITTGVKVDIRWPFAGTLLRNSVLADASGSIVLDIWKDTYANYPPTVADTITASAKPTLSSATKSEDTTMTGWTKTFAEGTTYRVNVDSATTVKRVTLELKYQRT